MSKEIKLPPLPDWTPCMKLPVVVHVREQRAGEAHVSTREGITPVNPDDLIMRGVSGEEYPIGRAIFEQTYTLDVEVERQGEAVSDALNTLCKMLHSGEEVEGDDGLACGKDSYGK